MNKTEKLLELIDDGVPVLAACESCDVDFDMLSEQAQKLLLSRHNRVKSNIMRKLYQATQKASANPSAIASAARAWIELSKDENQNGNVSISIEQISEDEIAEIKGR